MATQPEQKLPELKMEAASLCREEIYTDRKVGTIRCMIPVKTDGSADTSRKTHYVGEAQLLTPMGALPLAFDIPASTLEEAVTKFPDAAKVGIERAVKELQQMRREAASSLIIPDTGTTAGITGAVPGAPGGKIKLR